ncbi:SDR family oxidoreductase [Novosphingobium sp. Fuku2-ISO-50]|uniref:SDR family oxidoreductase n=1 Tax=Novosphingobium sp. Fuku2-ISO-50 TaxID=1739114 RepID=UPI00076C8FAF|nr:SDR family oxidoreductase [Novosphingobium sp. Fuku2-ISO-50]KUR76691.1 3-oxoacyl-ACP reductase [Novosphingobium sp. Fuku2-ISO-50]
MDTQTLFSVKGRVALVTGGSAGIGRMIAEGLADAGARVYICARNADKVAAAAAALPGDVIGLPADVSTLAGIEALVADLTARESALHILVNNAGTLSDAPIDTFSEEQWDSVLDLNLKTPFFLLQKLLPLLRAGALPDRPASVINIGSVGALKIGPREVYSYQASKGAIHWLTKSLAKKLAADAITVNAIAPGFFESDMTVITSDAMRKMVESMVPRGRTGLAEDVAGAAIYLASRAGSYVTGSVIPVEGGLSI